MKMYSAILAEHPETKDLQVITTFTGSRSYDYKMSCLNDLQRMGYRLSKAVFTTSKELILMNRLKFKLMELTEYSNRMREYELLNKDYGLKTVEQTMILYRDYENTLIRQVGLLVSRCYRRELEVTDELAIHCYNVRQQEIRERQAKEIELQIQEEF